ncbi:MAG: ribonuclease P protein component [Pseudomonadota bacterium]
MAQTEDNGLGTLRKRSEFLHVREGDYAARGAVVVQVRQTDIPSDPPAIRFGVTATKRIGNAVTRNRAKRRLRAVATALLPEMGVPGHDYVLIARDGTTGRDWERLVADARRALQSLPRPGQSPISKSAERSPRDTER